MVSFGKSKGVPKNVTPKANIQKLKSIICFGWHYTYYSDGSLAGKTSNNCWNASDGHHTVVITYPRREE